MWLHLTAWLLFSLITIVFWGLMGLLQKLSTNWISADAVFIWSRFGFLPVLVWFLVTTSFRNLGAADYALGAMVGVTNALGAWFLYASLASGAKASVAVPLTSLYPLLTILLAVAILHERPKALQWVGIVLAMVSGYLLSLGSTTSDVDAPSNSSDAIAANAHDAG